MATLRTLLKYKNPDLTSDLNHHLRYLARRGVFFGGQVTPVAGALQVDVQPFASIGSDGMVTLLEGTPERLAVVAGTTQYVLLHAQYRDNNSPIAELEVLPESTYNALSSLDKAARVRLAKITLSMGATEVPPGNILYVDADAIDPIDRFFIRGKVATKTDLPDWSYPPTGDTTVNRQDDIYFVSDERVFYEWKTTGTPQWARVISAAEEIALANHKLNQDDGTVPPDFYNAQHLVAVQKESLDDGPASLKTFGVLGTDYGPDNALIDEKYPSIKMVHKIIDLSTGVTEFQVSGKVFVGKGTIVPPTAPNYFRLVQGIGANDTANLPFVGSDGGPILIDSVRDATNTFVLNPATDADALGFYQDPWIILDFSMTVDTVAVGDMSVCCGVPAVLGQVTPEVALGLAPFGVETPGYHTAIGSENLTILTNPGNAQAAVDEIDSVLSGFRDRYGEEPLFRTYEVSVGPVGSGANIEGSTDAVFTTALALIASTPAGRKQSGTILVYPGLYTFNNTITVTSTINSLRVIGLGGPAVDPGQPAVAELRASGCNAIFKMPADPSWAQEVMEFSNLTFTNDATNTGRTEGLIHLEPTTVEQFSNSKVLIQDCYFKQTSYAIAIKKMSAVPLVVRNNTFWITAMNMAADKSSIYTTRGGTWILDNNFLVVPTTSLDIGLIKIHQGTSLPGNYVIRGNRVFVETPTASSDINFLYSDDANGGTVLVCENFIQSVNNAYVAGNCIHVENGGSFKIQNNAITWQGTIFDIASHTGTTLTLPLDGLDITGNDIYSYAGNLGNRLTVVSASRSILILGNSIIVATAESSSDALWSTMFPYYSTGSPLVVANNYWQVKAINRCYRFGAGYSLVEGNHFYLNPGSSADFALYLGSGYSTGASVGTKQLFCDNRVTAGSFLTTAGNLINVDDDYANNTFCTISGNYFEVGNYGVSSGAETGTFIWTNGSPRLSVTSNMFYGFANNLIGGDAVATVLWVCADNYVNSTLHFGSVGNGIVANNVVRKTREETGGLSDQFLIMLASSSFDNNYLFSAAPSSKSTAVRSTVIQTGAANIRIKGNYISFPRVNYLINDNSVNAANSIIEGNYFAPIDGALFTTTPTVGCGINLEGSSTCVVSNNRVTVKHLAGLGGIGIYVKSARVIGNYIEGDTSDNLTDLQYGIRDTGARSIIANNFITEAAYGIFCTQPDTYCIIDGNQVVNPSRLGISVGSYSSISGNNIFNLGVMYTGDTVGTYTARGILCLNFCQVIGNFIGGFSQTISSTTSDMAAIYVAGYGTSVVGNTIGTCGALTIGIYVSPNGLYGGAISANTIDQIGTSRTTVAAPNYTHGIFLADAANWSVAGNIIGPNSMGSVNCPAMGIRVSLGVSGGDHNSLVGNIIKNGSGGSWFIGINITINSPENMVMGNQLGGKGMTDNGINTYGTASATPAALGNFNNL